jgi:tRNA pseudouridine13 synthase
VIKFIPEDFIVEERADLPLGNRGGYRVYLLKKSNWTTLDLIYFLSHSISIPFKKFSYGGKKDKHGLTYQFITIKDKRDFSKRGKDFSLESKGFMERRMSPDLIRGNFFTVTIRNLPDFEHIEKNIKETKKFGFPNFFDDQRFRSFSPERGFFAEKILKGSWNDALQLFLTSIYPDMRRKGRESKEALLENWGDWKTCLSLAKYPLEKRIFRFLKDNPEDFAGALHLIAEEEISMLYSSFQSHLWNELLRRLIKQRVKVFEEIKGREGSYLFWRRLDDSAFFYFNNLEIPTSSAIMEFPDDSIRSLHQEILKERDLEISSFRTEILTKVYFKSFKRKAIIIPDDIQIIDKGKDDLHQGKMKMTLSFFLPRGSYGTMLMKRLSLEP